MRVSCALNQNTMGKKNKVQFGDAEIKFEDQYISLTDIAAQSSENRPAETIKSWMKNANTLLYLEEWEQLNNPDFKVDRMVHFKVSTMDNRSTISTSRYIEETGAIGITARRGRGGGTYAHVDIALNFCFWLSPSFALWMVRTFKDLLGAEAERRSLQFHIRRITDNIDEARNWLDTIPFQEEDRKRIKGGK